MPRRLARGAALVLAPAAAAVALAAAGAGPRAAEATPEPHFGIAFERPRVSIERVLRHEQLVVRYSCMRACDPEMRLRVGGVKISRFDPPGGATAGSRAAVFELGREDRGAIRAYTHRGVARFYLGAAFTGKSPGVETKSLRFALRR